MELLPADPEAQAVERQLYQDREAVLRILGDTLMRETDLNREAGQPVNYTDDELVHAYRFLHRTQMED